MVALAVIALAAPPSFPAWDGTETVAAYATRAGLKPTDSLDLGGGTRLELVLIPAGRFVMGATPEQARKCDISPDREGPPHPVTFARPFYVGKYEVTQAQWLAVGPAVVLPGGPPPAAKEPAKYGDDPVGGMSLADCQTFCTAAGKKAGREVRLPSEAEWEYAARGGTTTLFYFGDEWRRSVGKGAFVSVLDEHGWRPDDGKPGKVGRLKANPWGLYDVYGNVAERTLDPFHDGYAGAPADGSVWAANGETGMTWVRGGSAANGGKLHFHSASRSACLSVNFHADWLGLRVVVPVPAGGK